MGLFNTLLTTEPWHSLCHGPRALGRAKRRPTEKKKEPRGCLCPMKIVACLPSDVPPPLFTRGMCFSKPHTAIYEWWMFLTPFLLLIRTPHFHQGNSLILFLPEAGGPRDLGWPIKASLPWHALGDTPRASHSPQRCEETSLRH